MKTNKVKEKLKAGQLTLGSWITLGHPNVAEMMAQAGFDWLTIDLEHSMITIGEAERLIQTIDLAGSTPLVRVSSHEPDQIKRVMDAGAYGVIVPMVNTAEQCRQIVSSVKYPPVGTRGVGLSRAHGWGHDFQAYKLWQETQSLVVVQIEHIDAVKNLEAILSVPGVDAFMVGPYDLSGSLGIPGEFDHPKMKEALEQVRAVAAKKKIPSGFHVIAPEAGALKSRVDEGYKFVAFSFDAMFLSTIMRTELGKFNGKVTVS